MMAATILKQNPPMEQSCPHKRLPTIKNMLTMMASLMTSNSFRSMSCHVIDNKNSREVKHMVINDALTVG